MWPQLDVSVRCRASESHHIHSIAYTLLVVCVKFLFLFLEILDYRVNNSPLQFFVAGGNQTQCAYVQVIDDDIPETIEYFTLQLSSNEPRVVVTTPSALIRILDDDEQ